MICQDCANGADIAVTANALQPRTRPARRLHLPTRRAHAGHHPPEELTTMPRRILVISRPDEQKPILKLEVLGADMPHPGWVRFELEASAPDYEEPTVCWYRVPPEADTVELQSEVTEADVMARVTEREATP